MLYLCQIQVARSPRLWKHVGSPFASLVVLDQSRSVSRSRAIGHRWWRDHPKLCKPASMQIHSGTSRSRWWCHLLQSWLVWGAPCLLCCPAAPSAPPSALSLEHPEWEVGKETRAKNKFAKKYYLPELVATTVEHSWSWPCGETLNYIQDNGGALSNHFQFWHGSSNMPRNGQWRTNEEIWTDNWNRLFSIKG